MERTEMQSPHHLLTVELPIALYADLLAKVAITGKTETELVIQGLQQILGDLSEHSDYSDHQEEQDRFVALETALEQKLKQYVESLIKERVSSSESVELAPKSNPDVNVSVNRMMPIPTIRPLQVGDRVLILETDSPYYMAKLLVTRTSLIRATVETDTGEKTFLKRDLRFVESTIDYEL
jgi:hypothetical protein